MPEQLDDLVALLDLEPIEVNLFRGRQPDTRFQRVFGGQVLGQALVAAARTVDEERDVHSLHAHFLRGGDTAVPIVYDVESIRDGRSFSTRRVHARQHGRDIFYLVASFQGTEGGFDHQDLMPDVPPPDQCPTLGELVSNLTGQPVAAWEREWAALDVRYVGDSRPGGALADSTHPALARIWLRASDRLPDDPMLHKCVLSYASDLTLLGAALVPHRTFIGDPRLRPASLDHAMWFHRPFRADEWLLYDQASPSASGGRGLVFGRLFTASGELVATVAQEGLIRYVDDGFRDTTRNQVESR
ncbi:MAG: acyl-CoA thioesterase [Jiangellaceae bacterium]